MHAVRSLVGLVTAVAAALLMTNVALAIPDGGTSALASKGGTPKTAIVSSVSLDQTDAHLGSTVTFTVTAPRSVKAPRVSVRCSQGATLVYGEAGTFDHAFLLG